MILRLMSSVQKVSREEKRSQVEMTKGKEGFRNMPVKEKKSESLH